MKRRDALKYLLCNVRVIMKQDEVPENAPEHIYLEIVARKLMHIQMAAFTKSGKC